MVVLGSDWGAILYPSNVDNEIVYKTINSVPLSIVANEVALSNMLPECTYQGTYM